MSKPITKSEFEALACYPNIVKEERDVEYWYDAVLDRDGNEIAFATYRYGEEPTYTLRGE